MSDNDEYPENETDLTGEQLDRLMEGGEPVVLLPAGAGNRGGTSIHLRWDWRTVIEEQSG